MSNDLCRKWVGPVWKLDGETCVCKLRVDHADGQFGGDHECECGAWFVDSVACGWTDRMANRDTP
jgi:hypothetical protein